MNENKGDRNEVSEAWDQVGKAVNEATELYLKELGMYLGWVQNAQKEMLEQTIAASQQLSRIGEAQFAFLARMQKNFPLFGAVPKWTEPAGGAAEKRPGRAT
jgi:hypothetical protein